MSNHQPSHYIKHPTIMPHATKRAARLMFDLADINDCPRVKHDWCNFPMQCLHSHCCRSRREREFLGFISRKIEGGPGSYYGSYWAKQARLAGYDTLASIIACSCYELREDFIMCGESS